MYVCNLSSCEKKAWKKFRLARDSNPWPLKCQCSALPTELSSQLGAGHIVSFHFTCFVLSKKYASTFCGCGSYSFPPLERGNSNYKTKLVPDIIFYLFPSWKRGRGRNYGLQSSLHWNCDRRGMRCNFCHPVNHYVQPHSKEITWAASWQLNTQQPQGRFFLWQWHLPTKCPAHLWWW